MSGAGAVSNDDGGYGSGREPERAVKAGVEIVLECVEESTGLVEGMGEMYGFKRL